MQYRRVSCFAMEKLTVKLPFGKQMTWTFLHAVNTDRAITRHTRAYACTRISKPSRSRHISSARTRMYDVKEYKFSDWMPAGDTLHLFTCERELVSRKSLDFY